MINRRLACILICGTLLADSAMCQTPDPEVTVEEEVLLAFVQLGYFTDRGISAQLFQSLATSNADAEPDAEAETSISREVLELLKDREENLLQQSLKLSWLIETEDHSPKATISRFRKYGLIELFHNENAKLLDSPLSQRKELVSQFEAIADQISKTLAATYAKGLTEAQGVVIAGHLRTLSVELEVAIFKSLLPNERARIAKLVSCLLPGAIAEAKRCNRKFALGSAFLDKTCISGKRVSP